MIRASLLVGVLGLACAAQAAPIVVASSGSWQMSSVTNAGGASGVWTNPTLAPPIAGTFTLPVVLGGGVAAPGAAFLGVSGITAGAGVTYYRTTFNLVPFSSITAAVDVAVDNGIAVWINGLFVAAETTLAVANWANPLPSFDIATDGSITNIVKFDQSQAFTGFTAGANELIVAVRNLDGSDRGGFGFRMELDSVSVVPEPSSLALLGISLLLLGFTRAKKA